MRLARVQVVGCWRIGFVSWLVVDALRKRHKAWFFLFFLKSVLSSQTFNALCSARILKLVHKNIKFFACWKIKHFPYRLQTLVADEILLFIIIRFDAAVRKLEDDFRVRQSFLRRAITRGNHKFFKTFFHEFILVFDIQVE